MSEHGDWGEKRMLNMYSKYSKASDIYSIKLTPELTYLPSCLGSVTPTHNIVLNTQLAWRKTWRCKMTCMCVNSFPNPNQSLLRKRKELNRIVNPKHIGLILIPQDLKGEKFISFFSWGCRRWWDKTLMVLATSLFMLSHFSSNLPSSHTKNSLEVRASQVPFLLSPLNAPVSIFQHYLPKLPNPSKSTMLKLMLCVIYLLLHRQFSGESIPMNTPGLMGDPLR